MIGYYQGPIYSKGRPKMDPLELGIVEQRSIEEACAELRAKYKRQPTATLARMIETLQAEIAQRKREIAAATFPERESVA